MTAIPLAGRTALVTGVSRRRGIGFAVARRLAEDGASVAIHHHRAHDLDQPWGADDLDAVRGGIRSALVGDARFADVGGDFSAAEGAPAVFTEAAALLGPIDILVCNQARSGGDGSILDVDAETLDSFWHIDTRATLQLTSLFARQFAGGHGVAVRPGDRLESRGPYATPRGHVFWMTSGQQDGPMRGEVAYAASKAALAGVTPTVAAELLELGLVLNTINPGPVNTGYLDAETTDRDLTGIEAQVAALPFGRYGAPEDPANLIAWLCSAQGAWVVGQVLTSDGGFGLA